MTYEELEKAMSDKNDQNYKKYLEIRKKNLHKMKPIPVCTFNEEYTKLIKYYTGKKRFLLQ